MLQSAPRMKPVFPDAQAVCDAFPRAEAAIHARRLVVVELALCECVVVIPERTRDMLPYADRIADPGMLETERIIVEMMAR